MPPTARLLKQHHPSREDVPDGPLGSTPVEIRQIFDLSVHIAGDSTAAPSPREIRANHLTLASFLINICSPNYDHVERGD